MRFIITTLAFLLINIQLSGSTIRLFNSNKVGARQIYSIAQDKKGFLWVGTDYGLRRFDGTRFKSYLHSESDSTSLNENTVLKLIATENGNLWIATGDGLHIYMPETDSFKLIELPERDNHGYISDVSFDGNTGVWFIVGGLGLFHVNPEDTHADGPYLEGHNIGKIVRDNQGDYWLSSQMTSKVLRFNPKSSSVNVYDGIDGHFINIAKNDYGTPILITTSDIYVYDTNIDKFLVSDRTGLKTVSFNGAWCNDREGNFIVSTSDGIACMSSDYILKDFTLPHNNMKFVEVDKKYMALEYDSQSNLWIGNEGVGLIMLSPKEESFKYIDLEAISNSNVRSMISSVAQGEDTELWIALQNRNILHYKQTDEPFFIITAQGVPSALYYDKKDILYVWENGIGLCAYSIHSRKKNILYASTKYDYSTGITQDNRGNLFIAVDGYGLLKYNINNGDTKWFDSNSSKLVNNWITNIHKSDKDIIWIGHSGGVSWINTLTDEINTVPYSSWLRQVKCYSFDIDSCNNVWIGTSRGLCKLNPVTGELSKYSSSNGLSDEIVCAVAIDSEGFIWCSTPNGLNRINPKTHEIKNFYGGNGLVDKIYKKRIGFKAENGILYFSGDKGLTYFNPSIIKNDSLDSNVIISDLFIKDRNVNMTTKSGNRNVIVKPIHDAKEIFLSHEDNSFSLFLSMENFHDSENCYYEYRISDKDSEWNQLPLGESVLRYHHLSPGEYTLHIRARENDMVSPERVLKIHVGSPWYSSTIAKITYGILSLCILFLIFILLQRKRKNEINEAKLKYFMNISHDIRSPLTLIISPLETLMKKANDESTIRLTRIMHLNTMRIKTLIDQMLDIRKLDKGKLKLSFTKTEIVGYTRSLLEIFKFQAENCKIDLTLTSDASEIDAWIDVNNMDKVLANLISNAFKYTKERGSINVHISNATTPNSNKPILKITVSDTGVGLKDNEQFKIFDRFYQSHDNNTQAIGAGSGLGLNLCKMLVELHHGKIYAANRTDTTGCVFTIIIPQGNEHLTPNEIETCSDVKRQLLSHHIQSDNIIDNAVKTTTKNKDYKILIVDDSEEIVDYLSSQLQSNYKIIAANNGRRALVLAVKELPDLIISDIIMPEIDGLQLLQRLKSNVTTNHIPFIVISTLNAIENKIKGLKHGADGYIGKPFVMSELLAIIENLISNRQRLKGKYSGVQEQKDKIREIEIQGNEATLMDRIVQIVNENLDNQDFTVEILCKEVGISRGHLHRKMREYTGISASDFIRNIRLKKACELLKNKDIDISQIAYAVGFNNTGYFSTTFKRYCGITPTDYRNNHLK